MNKKLTFPELAELLSVATNTSKRMSELFLRELFATIAQSLIEGDSVKVKGLGVFKVSDVSSRKSIDVNTGQAIEIAGHKKITFTPDKSMAEAVNASFACFEAVVLDDDVTNEMIQEIDDEVAAPLADASSQGEAEELPVDNAASAEESIETVEVPEETAENTVTPPPFIISQIESSSTTPEPEPEEEVEEPTVAVEPEPAEPVEESQPEPEVAEPEPEEVVILEEVPAEAAEAEESQPEPDGQETGVQPIADMPQEQPEAAVDQQEDNSEELGGEEDSYDEDKHRRYRGRHRRHHSKSWYERNSFGLGFMAGALTGIAFAVAALLYLDNYGYITITRNKIETVRPAKEEVVEIVDSIDTRMAADTVASRTETAETEPAKPADKPAVVTDTVRTGNFLSRMARRFYGNSHFWVYIYEENRAKITNPNNVPEGTVVVIPPAEKYGIDAQNPESVEKARRKEGQVLNAYK